MNTDVWQVLGSLLTALGTILVAALAIWGDWFRERLAPVRVSLSLRSPAASFTLVGKERKKAVFWHIEVMNRRKWNPPKNIRLLITHIERKGPDGAFHRQELPVRLQLRWSHPEFHELSPTVIAHDTCDVGSLVQGEDHFEPSLYIKPFNFRGDVHKGEAVRFTVAGYADNYASAQPLIVEVAWDGDWGDSVEEMGRHLMVTQVQEGH
jgi:hypothetical protein